MTLAEEATEAARTINRLADGTAAARELYAEGAQFLVVREGARLEGIRAIGSSGQHQAGWYRRLHPGEVITCRGWREGMGGGGLEADFEMPGIPADELLWCQVWPQSGLFRPFPMEGYLTKIEGDDAR